MTEEMTLPVSYCVVCDGGKLVIRVPDKSCGHDVSNRRTYLLPVVAVDPDARLPESHR